MIAITGATGLLGSFIASKFILEGEQVVGIKREKSNISVVDHLQDKIQWRVADVADSISLSESFQGIHTVIHSAALVSFNPRKAKEIFDTNVIGTKNVVDACLASGVRKLIHISSVAALGRERGVQLISEENTWADSQLNSDYAISKYQAELEVFRGHEEGLHVSLVNPSVILAPANWNRSSSQLFKYIWNEKPFYTEGMLNYVDVRDVATIIHLLYKGDFNGERFIVNANHVSFKTIFDEIARRFNKKSPSIKVNPSLTGIVAWFEAIRCLLTNQEPIITKHTAHMAREPIHYDNKKALTKLKIQFHSLDETLDFCCKYYAQENTTNK